MRVATIISNITQIAARSHSDLQNLDVDDHRVGQSIFGDGSDGDATISATTTLTRDMYYNNLTIAAGKNLKTGGYRVFVKNTLTNNAYITNSGLAGGTQVNNGAASGSLGKGADGAGYLASGDKAQGGGGGGVLFIAARTLINTGAWILAWGGDGQQATAVNVGTGVGPAGNGANPSLGGASGKGGDANAQAGGAAGAVTAPTAAAGGYKAKISMYDLRTFLDNVVPQLIEGGAGGGGGAFDTVNKGGGGGGGGGVIVLLYRTKTLGTIAATGGTGGAAQGTGNAGDNGSNGSIIEIAAA